MEQKMPSENKYKWALLIIACIIIFSALLMGSNIPTANVVSNADGGGNSMGEIAKELTDAGFVQVDNEPGLEIVK